MPKTTAIVIGTGGFARHHIRNMLKQRRTTRMVGFVEVSEAQREQTRALFAEAGCACPPFYATIAELIGAQGSAETALICTPHVFHYANVAECLRAGMDVLVEKPMVVTADEARRLIRLRDKTGRLLVVAFPGSLSPAVQQAKKLLRAGKIGRVTGVAAFVHQRWKVATAGKWRQDPAVSGGGFLFDTGSHMVNTVVDLIGEDVHDVTALFDNAGTPVEINAAVAGRFAGGAQFTLMAAGDSVHCQSDIQVFGDSGVLQTGIWGERLRIKGKDKGEFEDVPYARSMGVWEQFLKVRAGRRQNPCPPEVGLRFAKLMDMIRASAAAGRAVRARG